MYRVAAIITLSVAAPAYAQDAAQISEPSHVALLALGVLGVVVGRAVAKRRNTDD